MEGVASMWQTGGKLSKSTQGSWSMYPKHEPCSSDNPENCVHILLVHPPIEVRRRWFFSFRNSLSSRYELRVLDYCGVHIWSIRSWFLEMLRYSRLGPSAKNQIPLFLPGFSCSGSRSATRDRSFLLPGSPCGQSPAHTGLCAPVPPLEQVILKTN